MMFSGIIQCCAFVSSLSKQASGVKLGLTVEKQYTNNLKCGASIAIEGVCLTVVALKKNSEKKVHVFFDIIFETLSVTNLGLLKEGDLVNFERSLCLGDEIGGHTVSGHIITMAKIKSFESNKDTILTCSLHKKWKKYLYNKTYITINGVSLTLKSVSPTSCDTVLFQVHLIPETISRTNLLLKKRGDQVNIEFYSTLRTIVDTIETIKSTGRIDFL